MLPNIVIFIFFAGVSLVFLASFTMVCYSMSPYAERETDAPLRTWEKRILLSVATYPLAALVLLIMTSFALQDMMPVSPHRHLTTVGYFCLGHALLSGLGATAAMHLRKVNRKHNIFLGANLIAGCIFFSFLLFAYLV